MLGKFITFEGGEGAGKSTQVKMLAEYLKGIGIDVLLTREIGGTLEGEEIRNLMLHSSDFMPIAELLLVMAARYQHLKRVIIPAINSGTWVICDRFIDSTACYQGVQYGIERVYALHQEVFGADHTMPDLTFFLDIPVELGLARTIDRVDNNKFESMKIDFHNTVRVNFNRLAAEYPNRIVRIDVSSDGPSEIHSVIVGYLEKFIKL